MDTYRQIVCIACGVTAMRYQLGKKTPFCRECSMRRLKESQIAHGRVGIATRKGHLEKPAAFLCADCGIPATQYDHRDYSQPLVVEPVCRPCNHKRPPAFDSKYRPA